jgi:hypothetical protein
MAMTVPPTTAQDALPLDGVASIDPSAQNIQVVFGGASGNNAVVIQGLDSVSFFGCSAHVKAETTPWNGVDTAVTAPTMLFETNYGISNGQVIVTINGMNASAGYRLTITPG